MWKTRIEQANDERQKPQHAWERVHAYRRLQSSGNLEERVTATNDYNEIAQQLFSELLRQTYSADYPTW